MFKLFSSSLGYSGKGLAPRISWSLRTQVAIGAFFAILLVFFASSNLLATNQIFGFPQNQSGELARLVLEKTEKLAKTNTALRTQINSALNIVFEQDLDNSKADIFGVPTSNHAQGSATEIEYLLAALSRTNENLARAKSEIESLRVQKTQLELEMNFVRERNSRFVAQVLDSVSLISGGLEDIFSSAGLSPNSLKRSVRDTYSGQGGYGDLEIFFNSEHDGTGTIDDIKMSSLADGISNLAEMRIAFLSLPFAKPVSDTFRYSSRFGYRLHPISGQRHHHMGLDFAAPTGTPVYAPGGGIVVYAGWFGNYGKLVRIRHMESIETYFAHLSKIRVKKGQRVSIGEQIGDIGSTGNSTGPHLHYEVRVNGTPVDPIKFMRAAENVF